MDSLPPELQRNYVVLDLSWPTSIINATLALGKVLEFPKACAKKIKPSLDMKHLANFQAISELMFLAKLLGEDSFSVALRL